jgi:hypothetical protein
MSIDSFYAPYKSSTVGFGLLEPVWNCGSSDG